MNWRLASRLSVITMALLVVAIVAIVGTHQGSASTNNATPTNQSGLQGGTDLGRVPAPDFSLTDQSGQTISLSQFKGKPVVLTFLYTHCPDVCPLTAEKLHTVRLNLGSDAQNVTMLAVSIDPTGDTTDSALSFSKTHNMQDYWHYLVGPRNTLQPIWTAYHVFTDSTDSPSTSVNHTSAVYIIDKQGNERLFSSGDFKVDQLTANLRTLLSEK